MSDEWQGPYQFFPEEDMRCKGHAKGLCKCGGKLPKHSLMVALVKLRMKVGSLPVSSGYRCPEYNAQVADTGLEGPHTTGLAVDLAVSHAKALKCIIYAYELGFRGFGISQKGIHRFLHLDFVPGRGEGILWSY